MDNVFFYISHDVTGCWIFGKEYEFFLDYECQNDFMIDRETILLSKGAAESKKPLPVLNALSKNFMKAYNDDPEQFEIENDPDKNVIPGILKKTIKDLKLDNSHLNQPEWTSPATITNSDHLYSTNANDAIVSFPLTFEIMNLIGHSVLFSKGRRAIGSDFRGLLTDYKDYTFYLSEIKLPTYLMNQRIKELTFRPVGFTCDDIANGAFQHAFALNDKSGILSLAWAELYFAQMYEMPFSTCTFCGKVYRLKQNLKQGSCGAEECKKSLKRERDQQRREDNPEEEKEKDRIRQQLFRDKRKAKELANKGQTAEEIQSFINNKAKKRKDSSGIRTVDEIKKWIRETK